MKRTFFKSVPNFGTYSRLWILGVFMFSFGQFACSNAHKQAIVLVAFGTSYPEANVAYKNIESEVRMAFPDAEIRWAYTSSFVRKKLSKKGINIPSPREAMEQMSADGYKSIAIQSLHVIPGSEYDDLAYTTDDYVGSINSENSVVIGLPLMYSHDDVASLSSVITTILPNQRLSSEAVVFMGHGTIKAANIYYPGLQYYLWQNDPLVFVGCVEGYPGLEEVIELLKKAKVSKVWLRPLMVVAGDHACNDMAGNNDESWKSRLEKEGFEVAVELRGLGEESVVAQLFIKHLQEAIHQEGVVVQKK